MNQYAIVGLGYVGLGLLVAFSQKRPVIGYDINVARIKGLQKHTDRNQLISAAALASDNITYTHDLQDIKQANFYIICVATPAYHYEMPDLEPLIKATEAMATVLKKGDILVFESTVYPGTTEEICIPLLEKGSHLKNGIDFHVGYSPERINPGDETHTLETITKVVAAQNPLILNRIQSAYASICDRVYPVSTIATAEAVKILENTQRDVNIAVMNEFSKIMHALNLNTHEIIEAAKTKWGFVPYKPGLVGGHCISIDPYYLAFQAKRHGVYPELILTARKVNNEITQFIMQAMIKILVNHKIDMHRIRIGLFGITYKENVLDTRNSLALKLLKELREYGFDCQVHDPLVNPKDSKVTLTALEDLQELSVAIVLVGHAFYKKMGLKKLLSHCKKTKIMLDIPNLFVQEVKEETSLIYWSL